MRTLVLNGDMRSGVRVVANPLLDKWHTHTNLASKPEPVKVTVTLSPATRNKLMDPALATMLAKVLP